MYLHKPTLKDIVNGAPLKKELSNLHLSDIYGL